MTVTTAIWASACQEAGIGSALADASAVRSRVVARTCSETRLRALSIAAEAFAASSAAGATLADALTSTVTARCSGGHGAVFIAAGAALTGFGYSLAFPGFGVEAVRRAPPQSRGVAMGAFVAFLDMSLGVTGPAAGAIASAAGVSTVYLVGAVAVTLSSVIALYLMLNPPAPVQ